MTLEASVPIMRMTEYLNSTLTVDFERIFDVGPLTGPAHVDGDWIIHRAWPEDRPSIVALWYVTHRASKRLAGAAPSLVLAQRMVRRLNLIKVKMDGERTKAGTREQVMMVMAGLPVFLAIGRTGWLCMADIPNIAAWTFPREVTP